MVGAYAGIFLLTAILVWINVRSAVREYEFHRYVPRLASEMLALLLVGAMLITVSYFIITRTMDAAFSLQEDALERKVPAILKRS